MGLNVEIDNTVGYEQGPQPRLPSQFVCLRSLLLSSLKGRSSLGGMSSLKVVSSDRQLDDFCCINITS